MILQRMMKRDNRQAVRQLGLAHRGAFRLISVLILFALLATGVATGIVARTPGCTAATSISYSVADLKALPAISVHYTFQKFQEPWSYYHQNYTGVTLAALLQEHLRPDAGASTVKVRAADGVAVELTFDEINAAYPGNRKIMLAYASDGKDLTGNEGPLRLIYPQKTLGSGDVICDNKPKNCECTGASIPRRDESTRGDMNTPRCLRMVRTIEVTPSAGTTAPAASKDTLGIYGAISVPPEAPAAPSGGAPGQPGQESGGAESQLTPEQLAEVVEAVAASAGKKGFAVWAGGSWMPFLFPGRIGAAMWTSFTVAGIELIK